MKAKKIQKRNAKRIKGITLIALVVTIVVLLILAAVSITAVFGDNGLLQMAKEAVDKTNEAVEKDLGDIQKIEDEIYDLMNPPTEVTTGNTQEKYIDIEEKFTIKVQGSTEAVTVNFSSDNNGVVSIDGNKVTGAKVGDATLTVTWSGSNSATINVHVYDPTTIGAPKRIEDYGKMVVGYTDTEANTNSGGYRLFYQDKNYTYLISNERISLDASLEEKYRSDYQNGASIKENSIGQRLNPMLKKSKVNDQDYTFFDAQNTNDNIKAVGWLTDPKNWTTYTNNESGVVAIGGPTIELFAASYNTMPLDDGSTDGNYKKDNIMVTVKPYGYDENANSDWLKTSQRHGIYNKTGAGFWWLASPGINGDKWLRIANEEKGYIGASSVDQIRAVRPLVCFQTSEFNSKYTLEDK